MSSLIQPLTNLDIAEDAADRERLVYEDPAIVAFYAEEDGLQKPEQAILRLLAPELPNARLLDIGVGAGRTTACLAHLVRDYVGVDFAEGMIDACRARFAGVQNSRFDVADARNLDRYADGSFDIVFFSFCGLDTLDYEDRMRALGEMKRVLRPGGYLWFSTHNKFRVPRMLRFMCSSPCYFPGQLRRLIRIHVKNFPARRRTSGEYFAIYNGAHEFRLRLLYIDPRRQVLDLQRLGFGDVRTFGLVEPLEIPSTAESLSRREDSWINFLCRRED
jgi:SAM-dependent methyltransferase